jgi:uncharacterized protein (DUF1330 family)
MTVYSMAELEINDMEAMRPYLEKVAATIAAHGGKYLVAGGEPEVIEGGLGQYPIKVLVEFASAEAFRGWYDSDEYQALIPFRRQNSNCNIYMLKGGSL